MTETAETSLRGAQPILAGAPVAPARPRSTQPESDERDSACFHCGAVCGPGAPRRDDKTFCCQGCLTVFELLTENGLGHFYDLGRQAGIQVRQSAKQEQFKYLDDPVVRERLLDFADEKTSRVTFQVPAIHCIACVWLLENLFRLRPGIGRSQVNFGKQEVAITFEHQRVPLSELVALLSAIGYEPVLNLANLEARQARPVQRRLWLQLGVAGFAFGNIMLFSITSYLGLTAGSEPGLVRFFGWLSVLLAVPVLVYSASDYWRSAWTGWRQRVLTIDLPICAGLAALFAQSAYEVITSGGEGYFDSLTGLVFFLLIGKVFQQKTYDRLSFDRDYKSFFPLSVLRRRGATEEMAPLSHIQVGDRLVLRHKELIPADATLISGRGVIDYSFVTGESDPVERRPGDHLYAGGQQIGAAIEVETVKPVSHSYLTSLWAHEAFAKERANTLNTLTNRVSRWFTLAVAAIALGAAAYWAVKEPARAVRAFTAVLIVACPCALALSAPFALGTAQRLLARQNVFVKNPQIIETLAGIETVVFDKTGTLTSPAGRQVTFHGQPLNTEEIAWISALTRHSTHPYSVQILAALLREPQQPNLLAVKEPHDLSAATIIARTDSMFRTEHSIRNDSSAATPNLGTALDAQEPSIRAPALAALPGPSPEVETFRETPGSGIEGMIADSNPNRDRGETNGEGVAAASAVSDARARGSASASTAHLWLGSAPWLASKGVTLPAHAQAVGSAVHLAINGQYRGHFQLASALRPKLGSLVRQLSRRYAMALLSGDTEKERRQFAALFGPNAILHFNQGPLDKLGFIRHRQQAGQRVMMVGDGLNDAGALKQSDVGIAVVENLGAFSPASDVILEADMVSRLPTILRFARGTVTVVYFSFLISILYNAAGLSVAASGMLSPLICAILMPLSSISVVAFACGATHWVARRMTNDE